MREFLAGCRLMERLHEKLIVYLEFYVSLSCVPVRSWEQNILQSSSIFNKSATYTLVFCARRNKNFSDSIFQKPICLLENSLFMPIYWLVRPRVADSKERHEQVSGLLSLSFFLSLPAPLSFKKVRGVSCHEQSIRTWGMRSSDPTALPLHPPLLHSSLYSPLLFSILLSGQHDLT